MECDVADWCGGLECCGDVSLAGRGGAEVAVTRVRVLRLMLQAWFHAEHGSLKADFRATVSGYLCATWGILGRWGKIPTEIVLWIVATDSGFAENSCVEHPRARDAQARRTRSQRVEGPRTTGLLSHVGSKNPARRGGFGRCAADDGPRGKRSAAGLYSTATADEALFRRR